MVQRQVMLVPHIGRFFDYLTMESGSGSPRVMIISGVHGDEPGGPLGVERWIKEGVSPKVSLLIIPIVNVDGLKASTREWRGVDLNRHFSSPDAETPAGEVMSLAADFKPDAFLDIHEIDRDEPHIYKIGDACLVDLLAKETNALIEPWDDSPEWTGTSEVAMRKAFSLRFSLTAEAAWNRPLSQRVDWIASSLLPSFLSLVNKNSKT